MLITCPECSHEVSDKAFACPNCGYPINPQPVAEKPAGKPKKKRTKEHLKLPNGFGSIKHLSGNRRKPYAVYPPRTYDCYDDNGHEITPKALGYFENWYQAYDCLAQYNGMRGRVAVTFSEVYEQWWYDKFEKPTAQRRFSESAKKNYSWAYGLSKSLYDIPMVDIHKSEMQAVIDANSDKSFSCQNALVNLFGQMSKYSIQEGIIDRSYVEFLDLKKNDSEKGEPLTEEELSALWKHTDDNLVQIALILAYSGLRVSELKNTTIDLERGVFEGGMKTTAGKNRIVPIHHKIRQFVENFDQAKYSPANYTDKQFDKVKYVCHFEPLTNGKKHTPHDLRHTFSWLCDTYGVDEIAKHLLMGHSLGQDVERNTYGHRTEEQLRTEIEKIQ